MSLSIRFKPSTPTDSFYVSVVCHAFDLAKKLSVCTFIVDQHQRWNSAIKSSTGVMSLWSSSCKAPTAALCSQVEWTSSRREWERERETGQIQFGVGSNQSDHHKDFVNRIAHYVDDLPSTRFVVRLVSSSHVRDKSEGFVQFPSPTTGWLTALLLLLVFHG